MDNNVVTALQKVLSGSGWGTLRFNFRGVGGSGGQHRGSEGDVDDLMGVIRYLLEQEIKKVHFAGYSYGAWIGLKALKRGLALETMLLVSPPVDFLSFKDLQVPPIPCLITVGDRDEFCSLASLENWLSSQGMENSKLRVETIPHCDHFYWGREEALTRVVSDFLEKFRCESQKSKGIRAGG